MEKDRLQIMRYTAHILDRLPVDLDGSNPHGFCKLIDKHPRIGIGI